MNDSGTVAAEFAVILPVLILIMIALFDYASAMVISTRLFSAARAGAQYALYFPGDTTGITATAGSATTDTNMTVTIPTDVYNCISVSTGSISATNEPQDYACGPGFILGHFITVSTTQTYTPLIGYDGLGAALTMNGLAQIQVQ